MKKTSFFLVLIATTLLFSGCLDEPRDPRTVRFGYKPTPGQLAGVIVVKQGFLAEQNIKVQEVILSSGSKIIEASIANDVDIGLASSTHIISAYTEGAEIVVLAGSSYGGGRKRLMVRSDLQANSVSDLVGKKVAIPTGGLTFKDFLKLLELNGLEESQFEIIKLDKSGDLAPALAGNQVDAVVCPEPNCAIIETEGIGWELANFEEISLDPNNVFARKSFVEENPELVKKFLRAWLKAESFIEGNREKAIKIMSEESGEELEVMQIASKNVYFSPLVTEQIIQAYKDDAAFLLETENISNANLDGLFQLEPLNSVVNE